MQDVFGNVVADSVNYVEADAIEILGYAMNDIVEATDKLKRLPYEYMEKLGDAYTLLNEVQEYLFNN